MMTVFSPSVRDSPPRNGKGQPCLSKAELSVTFIEPTVQH
jgi:hypothetical protein